MHTASAEREQRMDHGTWFRGRCSCGDYIGMLSASHARALRAAQEHAQAKNEQEGTNADDDAGSD